MKKRVLFVFGTRPETIKLASLIKLYKSRKKEYETFVLVTGQHKEMLYQALDLFQIVPDKDLKIMSHNQNLTDLTVNIVSGVSDVMNEFNPDLLFVQGDTTSTFAASIAAFYNKVPVAHIEAGLRTGNLYSPFPEEANRRLTGVISTYHFPPTKESAQNLLKEGYDKNNIYISGNTVIDSLLTISEELEGKEISENLENWFRKNYGISFDNSIRTILVTGHRRESFGEGFLNICNALKEIANQESIQIIYPVHLNPNVQDPVNSILKKSPNIFLIEPQEYKPFVFLMKKSYFILTDSGGIQEEAPSLGKPVLLMRENTERTEGIKSGSSILVGVEKEMIVNETSSLLHNEDLYAKMSNVVNPYGSGNSAQIIFEALKEKI